MRVYKTPEIRNVAVVGHGASGKTSLVDALAPWPTTATLRISGVLYTRIAQAAPAGDQENMRRQTVTRLDSRSLKRFTTVRLCV